MPALPDLSDMSGGLSNPAYFNFLTYITLKVVARYVKTPEARSAFCVASGRELLDLVWPEGRATAAAMAPAGGGRATESQLLSLVTSLLERLQAGHYICHYQVTWGDTPGGWPSDWMTAQASLQGNPPNDTPVSAEGLAFQVLYYQPADIAASVALRSEEYGFWGRTTSSMLTTLFTEAGYPQATPSEYFLQDRWSGPVTLIDKFLLQFGDPLQRAVGIPFDPTTLVQDWQL